MLLIGTFANAQKTQEDKRKKKLFEPNNAVILAPIYTAQFPFGNMADRFGFNSLFGMHVAYKTKKNWMVGVDTKIEALKMKGLWYI